MERRYLPLGALNAAFEPADDVAFGALGLRTPIAGDRRPNPVGEAVVGEGFDVAGNAVGGGVVRECVTVAPVVAPAGTEEHDRHVGMALADQRDHVVAVERGRDGVRPGAVGSDEENGRCRPRRRTRRG